MTSSLSSLISQQSISLENEDDSSPESGPERHGYRSLEVLPSGPNREAVEKIGERIRQLRESRGMTQSQLQVHSHVSRSYLSRIESGQMTPSLGTLEKISEALRMGMDRFFTRESAAEVLINDPFIQAAHPFVPQLNRAQWEWVLKLLEKITASMAQPQPSPEKLIA